MDDQSGRQHWSIVPVTGVAGQYYIVANGRPGTCGSYVSLPTCASGLNGVQFVAGDDGTMSVATSLHVMSTPPAMPALFSDAAVGSLAGEQLAKVCTPCRLWLEMMV